MNNKEKFDFLEQHRMTGYCLSLVVDCEVVEVEGRLVSVKLELNNFDLGMIPLKTGYLKTRHFLGTKLYAKYQKNPSLESLIGKAIYCHITCESDCIFIDEILSDDLEADHKRLVKQLQDEGLDSICTYLPIFSFIDENFYSGFFGGKTTLLFKNVKVLKSTLDEKVWLVQKEDRATVFIRDVKELLGGEGIQYLNKRNVQLVFNLFCVGNSVWLGQINTDPDTDYKSKITSSGISIHTINYERKTSGVRSESSDLIKYGYHLPKHIRDVLLFIYNYFSIFKENKSELLSHSDILCLKEVVSWANELKLPELSYDREVDTIGFYGLPRDIDRLSSIKILDIPKSNIQEIPKEIERLSHLNCLYVNNNRIENFPKEIYNLKGLKHIVAHDNNFSELPEEIENLTNLEVLNFRNNQISTLPKEIQYLNKLTGLGLSNNFLGNFPEEIYKLVNLEVLGLSGNQIVFLSDSVGNLISLTDLNISNNLLTTLPSGIGNLSSLESLDISENNFINLPNELVLLESLRELEISEEHLILLPKEIFRIKDLKLKIHDGDEIYDIDASDIRKNMAIANILKGPAL